MKWMIASDLHGSYYYAQQLQQAFEREQADRLLFLGDLLYHGPRNDLPRDYAPKKVIPLLNSLAPKLLCVRGNCDAYSRSDAEENLLFNADGVRIFMTHGHRYNVKLGYESLANAAHFSGAQLALFGHTHEALETYDDGLYILNPGSCSGFRATCGLVDISPAGILTNILHIN